MIGGLNQEVEILGKRFHVQTELTDTEGRTEVFLGGKLVAARETPLSPTGLDSVDLKNAMQEQYNRILETVVERARRCRERRQEAATGTAGGAPADEAERPEPVSRPAPPAAPVPASGMPAAPNPEVAGPVDLGLRVRRLLDQFRRRLPPWPQDPEDTPSNYLRLAATAFCWMLSSPGFPEIRVEEQVRFNLLHDQVDGWLHGDRDPVHGLRVRTEIVAFNDYLAGINNRAELTAFDRDLLAWALRQVEREGVTERLREHLAMVAGRDGELDRLLAEQERRDEVWRAELRRVLAELDG